MRLSLTAEARREGVAAKGWVRAHKWWILRRLTQLTALGVFMAGPLAGIWLVRGNFASSEILGFLPLSDPFIAVQSLAAGAVLARVALLGALLITLFYIVVGGRAYCGWICPVNIVTDTAYWLREKLGITRDRKLDRRTRLWVLGGALLASLLSGTVAWEFVNPVSLLQRGLIFGLGAGWTIIAAVFLLDLLITRRGWCGHLCPVGAFYGIMGKASVVRVAASRREACTNCGACFQICTEPHVITPALKGRGTMSILNQDCLNCGSCIDACPVDVFEISVRRNIR
ncbi:quinol dehydrogenase ferredoxin subunit NapH [Methylorubrum rhodesianum]|uniref:quinol dehydrogenase ferredoxin subunit NapH n=1 Tax=Methylorubrum TaxID=2282523 RepID=UPI00160BB59E|nr:MULTISPECIES: quinol dehydrogenase ferredoxin subunit NapH [Methylorubrum]MBB5765773.1 ferredoxin-type protein NapH [Methylorubrum rhodesianum]MBI1692105.1 quinol dehydrogenase ferredoxin subunit NapH [Methylorubrum sp. DB1722]